MGKAKLAHLGQIFGRVLINMKLPDRHSAIAVAAGIESCLSTIGNVFAFSDTENLIRIREKARRRADVLKQFKPLAGRVSVH